MAITKSRKTVSIGGKNYKEGSKAASGAISAGGTVSKDAGTIRANANASKARTAALSAADPLTVADNMGIETPDRIEADEMAGVVEDLASKGAVAKPLPAAQAAAVAPVAPPASGTPAGVSPPPTPTQSRYQTGLSTLQNSGIPAPSDAGAARMQLASAVPQAPEDTTAVDNFISEDPAINGLMANIATLLNPQNQTTSLMQDYKKLYKQSGLDEINEELIDAETVIDGTEDDIRNEIQTAGGLATDSQVQAMSLARNKGLLKRYNQLVQMKTDATNQLNTLVQLNGQDKQIAQQRIDSQISAMFNMANFRQNATNNTRQQYQWMASQMGADGLYNSLSQDPRQLAFAEKILGTGPGGLQKLATQAASDRARKVQMENLDMAATRASINASNASAAKAAYELEQLKNPPLDITDYQQERSTRVISTALDLFDRANNSTVGFGSFMSMFPGSPAKDFQTDLSSLKGNVFAAELQAMRADSKTGGAVGNASDKEGEKLENALAGLDQAQSVPSFKKNMVQATDAIIRYHQAKGDPSYIGVVVDSDPTSATFGSLIRLTQ